MLDKNEVAKELADAHRMIEPTINRIVRLIADREQETCEPLKLLEVNPDTSPSGILPIVFGADPPRIPFPSVVIEVTEGEYAEICVGSLPLPDGWRIGETLFPTGA